ncbi:hypothetical protein ASD98_08625 [Flavobacterium sp. Root186]|nr:hypothetical protein ASD98_08625 [Flavobacterium sp. Root186]
MILGKQQQHVVFGRRAILKFCSQINAVLSFCDCKDWEKKALKKTNARCADISILGLYKVVQKANRAHFYGSK